MSYQCWLSTKFHKCKPASVFPPVLATKFLPNSSSYLPNYQYKFENSLHLTTP
uniref:Uncharacterized protein n=1 Tax=Arion vulgaris TaxID=1028688 RepID=A0A0B6Z953_9EUPU